MKEFFSLLGAWALAMYLMGAFWSASVYITQWSYDTRGICVWSAILFAAITKVCIYESRKSDSQTSRY